MNTEILQKIIDTATKEIGTKEVVGKKDNPRIVEYHSKTSLKAQSDEVPWCSAFVNWVTEKCGLTGTYNAAARSWLSWGIKSEFVPGCIVVMKRGNSSWQGHVGIGIKKVGPVVWVLGGNQSDEVNISKYSTFKILGYRIPREALV
jgi:uncharacterized protein (TIGR02594 family)